MKDFYINLHIDSGRQRRYFNFTLWFWPFNLRYWRLEYVRIGWYFMFMVGPLHLCLAIGHPKNREYYV